MWKYCRFTSDAGPIDLKDKGSQREASALRDEVWTFILSWFECDACRAADLFFCNSISNPLIPCWHLFELQLDMLQEENEVILDKVSFPSALPSKLRTKKGTSEHNKFIKLCWYKLFVLSYAWICSAASACGRKAWRSWGQSQGAWETGMHSQLVGNLHFIIDGFLHMLAE